MLRALGIFGLAVQMLPFNIVQAQSPSDGEKTRLETIVVTGTRIEQTAAEAGSTVRVIDAARIEALGFNQALDVIASAPGVTINQNGAFGGTATVSIRGASSDQTLVLIDGVSVNDTTSPGGGFDFARLDTEHIERIEILSGPQSTLWGTDAIGGVVSIVTKRPREGLSGNVFAQAGSFGAHRAGASLSRGGNRGDFRITATRLATDGISKADERNGNPEDDSFDSLSLAVQGGIELPAGARLDARVLQTDATNEFDSFVFGAQGNVGDGDEVSQTKERSANLSLTAPLFGGRLDNLLMIGHAEIDRHNVSNGAPSFDAEGERTLFRYQGTLRIDTRNTLAAGVEREESTTNLDRSSLDGLFALYELSPSQDLNLTAGLRSDDHDRFGSETTARLAAAYRLNSAMTLRGSWGEGFKAPTIFQSTFFCCGATGANTALRPERSEGIDVGLDWRSPSARTRTGVTLFRQDTEDLIVFSFGVGGYENIAEVESEGVEISARWTISPSLELLADYAWINATDGRGMALQYLPRHSGDLALSFDPAGPYSGSVLLRYNGPETDRSGIEVDEWTRIDISARYELSADVELYARLENVLDTHYQQVLGYGTPGRSAWVGARWRY